MSSTEEATGISLIPTVIEFPSASRKPIVGRPYLLQDGEVVSRVGPGRRHKDQLE